LSDWLIIAPAQINGLAHPKFLRQVSSESGEAPSCARVHAGLAAIGLSYSQI